MAPKTDSEEPAAPPTPINRECLEQPMLTTEEMAALRRSSKEALAEFRAILDRERN